MLRIVRDVALKLKPGDGMTADETGVEITRRMRGPFLTESSVFDGGRRELVIELHPNHLRLRQKGRRKGTLSMSYETLWSLAWKLQMAERAKAKKAGKK